MRIFKATMLIIAGFAASVLMILPGKAVSEQNAVTAYPLLSVGDNANNNSVEKLIQNSWSLRDILYSPNYKKMLIPSGEPFGIKFFTEGVLIIGLSEVKTASGGENPAFYAGIREKDIILSIDNKKISSNEEMAEIVTTSAGKELSILIKRNNSQFTIKVKPVLSIDNNYKLGIWIRDSTAGVGTITFIDPLTGEFGGLGHGICDVDTGELMPLGSADIYGADIVGINIGKKGLPGELKGQFIESLPIGNLRINSNQGVFGVLKNGYTKKTAYETALSNEITTGPATILCTIDGKTPKEYTVNIEKVYKSSGTEKNMLIKITDPELLEKTGGIVQGMSGSPIIQNGKLIGAVTHVLVNDPTKGFGIFIENMLRTAMDNKKAA